MGAQEALSVEPAPPEEARRRREPEVPRAAFLGVVAASSLLLVFLSRRVFLFWDDFFFLGQAHEAGLTWGYLTDPLFKHFSPVVRLINWVVVGALPGHPWVVLLVQAVLLVAVVAAVTWLLVVLHGRTRPALVGAVLLAPSLTLVPLGNWWTAGVNIMPALVGCYLAFGGMVQLLRGRSRWYAVPCLAGAAVGVLDYELPILLVGYLALWFLLFGARLTPDPWPAALRRTAWVWGGVAAICLVGAVNYRLNYYDPVERPAVLDVVHALGRSLVRTLVPTALGFHDPRSAAFSALSLGIGCVALTAVVGYLLATRDQAWRGLVFATAGWLLPSAALVLNRVSLYGVQVVDNAIYFHLPTVLFVVGLLEAWRAPRRAGSAPLRPARWVRRVLVPAGLLAMVAGYAWSASPTATYQLPQGASPDFADQARGSVQRLLAAGEPFTVINSDVPPYVVPGEFKPYNRADRVLGVVAPPVTFDEPVPPYYRFASTGELASVDVDWVAEADATSGDLRLRDVEREDRDELCFTATESSSVVWSLGEEVPGPDLVVRTLATVDGDSTVRVNVRGDGTDAFDRANVDEHVLRPAGTGVLDTVAAASVDAVRVKEFSPGTRVCVESVSVGRLRQVG